MSTEGITPVPVYAIRFERLDNHARMELNGRHADTGPPLPDATICDMLIPIDSAMTSGDNVVTIEVWKELPGSAITNESAPQDDRAAAASSRVLLPWQVRYKIEREGEPITVVEYSGAMTAPGLVLRLQHVFVWPFARDARYPDYAPFVRLSHQAAAQSAMLPQGNDPV